MDITKAITVLKAYCTEDLEALEAVAVVEDAVNKMNKATSKQIYAINKMLENSELVASEAFSEVGIQGTMATLTKTDASKLIKFLKK